MCKFLTANAHVFVWDLVVFNIPVMILTKSVNYRYFWDSDNQKKEINQHDNIQSVFAAMTQRVHINLMQAMTTYTSETALCDIFDQGLCYVALSKST